MTGCLQTSFYQKHQVSFGGLLVTLRHFTLKYPFHGGSTSLSRDFIVLYPALASPVLLFSSVLYIFVFVNLMPWAEGIQGGEGTKMQGMALPPALTRLPSWKTDVAGWLSGSTSGGPWEPEVGVSQQHRLDPSGAWHPGLGALGNPEQLPQPFPGFGHGQLWVTIENGTWLLSPSHIHILHRRETFSSLLLQAS